jgi:antirestriction protein ArdC
MESRMNRKVPVRFGGREWCVLIEARPSRPNAELGAAFMCATFGLANEPRQDHAAYVATWLEVLDNDSRAIFRAASRAQEAIEYLGNLAAEKLDRIEAVPTMSLQEPPA